MASAGSDGKRNLVSAPAMKMMAVKSRNACSIEGNAGVDWLSPSLNEGVSAVSAPAASEGLMTSIKVGNHVWRALAGP